MTDRCKACGSPLYVSTAYDERTRRAVIRECIIIAQNHVLFELESHKRMTVDRRKTFAAGRALGAAAVKRMLEEFLGEPARCDTEEYTREYMERIMDALDNEKSPRPA